MRSRDWGRNLTQDLQENFRGCYVSWNLMETAPTGRYRKVIFHLWRMVATYVLVMEIHHLEVQVQQWCLQYTWLRQDQVTTSQQWSQKMLNCGRKQLILNVPHLKRIKF